jgi:hypothetical protein
MHPSIEEKKDPQVLMQGVARLGCQMGSAQLRFLLASVHLQQGTPCYSCIPT